MLFIISLAYHGKLVVGAGFEPATPCPIDPEDNNRETLSAYSIDFDYAGD